MRFELFVTMAAAAALHAQNAPGAGGSPQRPDPMLLPQVLALPREAREIAIDGSLTDWPALPAARLDDRRQLSGTAFNAWNGPNDLGAQAFVMWDAEALFVACAVKDEWHRALDSKTLQLTEIPACDAIVLTFDPARDTRGGTEDPGRQEDREFWLADEASRKVVQWDRLRGTARQLDGTNGRIVAVHDKERGITSYEARIPWSEILPVGKQPRAGDVLDLQIVVNDFDETTDTMPQTRIGLTFGCGAVVDPGLLASMMLVGDFAPMQGRVPEFPPKPGAKATNDEGEWQQRIANLLASPPEVFSGSGAASECGGVRRLAALEAIESACERMPRVEHLELHQRIHRRMGREVAGLTARGLPWFWRQRLAAVGKEAKDPVPDGAVRIFRLPMGGWLVRSAQRNYAVDATGADFEKLVGEVVDFCVLTQPLDMTRRNDQLLVRMYMAEPPRTVLTHLAFHLPVVPMELMALVEPGKTYPSSTGAQIHAFGTKRDDGSVAWSCSYRIDTPGAARLLFVGPNLTAGDVEAKCADVAIVSPRNPELQAVLAKVEPSLVILDDTFLCQTHAGLDRVRLRDLHAIQQALSKTPTLLLAPGESWTVKAPGK
jgi:hypothetical protein